MTILVNRFSINKHYRNSNEYEWQVLDHEKLQVLCRFPSSGEYKDKELKKLAEKVASHIDELVANGDVII